MNNTNRALNRIGIAIFGLLLLIVGGGVAAAAAVPDWLAAWKVGARRLTTGLPAALASPGSLALIVLVALVLIVLLLVAVFRQGHGHTGTLITRNNGDIDGMTGEGTLIIDSAVAEDSIGAALREYPGLAGASVSTYLVNGKATLKIAVSARRGVSPRAIRDHIDGIVERWDALLGEEIPVFVKINGGFVSRVAKTSRLPERQTA